MMRNAFVKIPITLFIFCGILLSCQKEFSQEGSVAANETPLSNAGTDQVIIFPTDSILLDGTASVDPDGKIAAWQWSKIAGPTSSRINSPDSSKTKVALLVQGVYQFELKVTDDKGASAKDTVQITVVPATNTNRPPLACAGEDHEIDLPVNTAILDGRCSSDPDNNISSYLWTKISGPASFSIAASTAVQTQVTNLEEGRYQFQLKVTDATGSSSYDTVQVTVNNAANNSAVDIYVAGMSNSRAVYWKNGLPVEVDAGTSANAAMAITVVGKDVYVAGDEGDFFTYGNNRAKYWKNGQQVYLTGPIGAGTTSIAVDGSDVYVAGWEINGKNTIAVYWKNGQRIPLTDGKFDATAKSIVIDRGDVYVAGFENSDAKYWKNGQAISLTTGSIQASGNSIAIVGSDVYVAGEESDGAVLVAKYWKNGKAIALSDGSDMASATSIVVTGGNVHVVGYEGGYYNTSASYWKNGQKTTLSRISGSAHAMAMAILDNDVYVAGTDGGPNNSVAKYWKNGQGFVLPGPLGAWVTGIAVVPR